MSNKNKNNNNESYSNKNNEKKRKKKKYYAAHVNLHIGNLKIVLRGLRYFNNKNFITILNI